MKLMKSLTVAGLVTFFVAGGAVAQTNPVATAAQPNRDGQVVVPERPTATDGANVIANNLRPPRPERPKLSAEVQARIDRFKLDARAYLERQQALEKQIKGANEKDRAALREQLKELREAWIERTREIRKEYKERQAELADKLTEYRELLKDIRTTTLQDAQRRARRGDD